MNNRQAFSLIELLVVVLICAVFTALIAPGFSEDSEKARQAACMENHRKLAQAALMYAEDYGGVFQITGSTNAHWYVQPLTGIRTVGAYRSEGIEYLKWGGSVFYCPSLTTENQLEYQNRTAFRYINWSMGPHFVAYPGNAVESGEAYEYADVADADGNEGAWGIHSIVPRRAEDPANYWFFTENFDARNECQVAFMREAHVDGSHIGRAIHLRHGGKANMSFLDGHVESVDRDRLKEVGPVPFAQAFEKDFRYRRF